MKASILTFLCFLFLNVLHSQPVSKTPITHALAITGNGIINPGLSYSLIRPLPKKISLPGLIRATEKRKYRLAATVGMYWDPFSHMGFQNFYNLQVQTHLLSNIDFEYGVGGGFQVRVTGENYIVDDNFNIEKRAFRSTWYLMGNGFAGLKFNNKDSTSSSFLRAHVFLLTPYNMAIVPTFMIELGKEF